jgi:hypothetical protein
LSKKQVVIHQVSISIVDVLDVILEVLCKIGTDSTTDNKIKVLISEAYNIVISAKFGYCSKIPNLLYVQDKDRAIYEKEWLKKWYEQPSNITKTYFVFSQVRQKFYLLSEVEQRSVSDMKIIQDALVKIDEWMMSQTDYDVSILVT